jgi:small subunit ribosomal protein S2
VPLVTAQELIDAGVHYGHQASRWNPKMKPFIHGKRHKIHVINLEETIRGLYRATHFLRHLAATGSQIMFLGTKKQIRPVVEAEAKKCSMPPVTERWIGGTLTNFATVRERLARLIELEQLETTGGIEKYKKKDQSTMRREMKRIRRNLEGVRDLHGLPGALIVVDPRREDNAMREAKRMNVPVVCVLDTDCDPTLADIVIPANDDAMSSVQLILSKLSEAVLEGRKQCDEGTLRDAQRTASDDVRNRPVAAAPKVAMAAVAAVAMVVAVAAAQVAVGAARVVRVAAVVATSRADSSRSARSNLAVSSRARNSLAATPIRSRSVPIALKKRRLPDRAGREPASRSALLANHGAQHLPFTTFCNCSAAALLRPFLRDMP